MMRGDVWDVFNPKGACLSAVAAHVLDWDVDRICQALSLSRLDTHDADRAMWGCQLVRCHRPASLQLAPRRTKSDQPESPRYIVVDRAAFEAWCGEVRRSYAEHELTR